MFLMYLTWGEHACRRTTLLLGSGWETLDNLNHGDRNQKPAYGPCARADKGEAGIEKRGGRFDQGTSCDLHNFSVWEIRIDETLLSSIGEAAESNETCNVEKAMLALSRPYTKEGEVRRICHCGQAVIYVREIRSLYHNYVRLTETTQIARAEIPLRVRDI